MQKNNRDRQKYIKDETHRIEETIKALPKSFPYAMEIKKIGLQHAREGIRQEYDRLKEEMAAAQEGIDKELKLEESKQNKKALEIWNKMVSDRKQDTDQLKGMIEQMDREIDEITDENTEKLMINRIEKARAYLDLLKDLKKKR